MYAVAKRQAANVQLLIKLTKPQITTVDAIRNNLLHLAFPLPDALYEPGKENSSEEVLDMIGAEIGEKGSEAKTAQAIKAILTEKSIPLVDKLKALTSVSLANFTPVSLAAATGYTESYEFMKNFLDEHGNKWDRSEHTRVARTIEDIEVEGLELLLKSKKEHQGLRNGEEEKFQKLIQEKKSALDAQEVKAIKVIYNPRVAEARKLFDVIDAKMKAEKKRVYKALNSGNGEDEDVAIYPSILKAAINEMMNPAQIRKDIAVGYQEPARREKKHKPGKPVRDWFRKTFKVPKKEKAGDSAEFSQPVLLTDTVFEKSPLLGMKESTPAVQASYLAGVLEYVTGLYLSDNENAGAVSYKAAYQVVTGSNSTNFFKKKFSGTVEEHMKRTLITLLQENDRYRAEEDDDAVEGSEFDRITTYSDDEEEDDEEITQTEKVKDDW